MSHYFFTDEPRPAPFNADDLTKEGSDELSTFLAQRVLELRESHAAGSPEDRAARALEMSAGALVDELNLRFEDEEPETLRARMRAWNQLVFVVWPWEGTAGYDAHRWRLVKHVDADAAVEAARHLLQSREELAEKKRTERAGR
ncbi:hypothetical protein OG863_09800 [Streptomyces decoyicus]|uniref:Uncharacterized protein n=1 Tax=Streptomyces decoyicus TaxID=249567 RepID=A0ABZ1FD85_9ACTN|nr:hypothetical protein [Streptomyces decoyicus]WSB68225.1 hypothetical protein OG863_09800 [Streptomyces decoyicus]